MYEKAGASKMPVSAFFISVREDFAAHGLPPASKKNFVGNIFTIINYKTQ